MPGIFRIALLMVPSLLLACGQTALAPVEEPATVLRNEAAPTVEASDVFAKVCLATAPDFIGARSRMARVGLTDERSTGTTYDASGQVSAKVQSRTEVGGINVDRCSVVFDTADNDRVLARLTQMVDASGVADGPPTPTIIGSRAAQVWAVVIDGRPGRVIYVPRRSARLLGGIYLDMPSERASV